MNRFGGDEFKKQTFEQIHGKRVGLRRSSYVVTFFSTDGGQVVTVEHQRAG